MRKRLFECASCGRRFKVPQALFGHLRHCMYHRLRRQAKAKAGNQPSEQYQSQQSTPKPSAGRTNTAAFSYRHGRDSQENLLLLLDTSEFLPELKNKCLDYAAICRMLANLRPWMTTAKEWVDLYWIIDECERDYEQMFLSLRLNRRILFRIYQQMLGVKDRWLYYLSNDFRKVTEPVCKESNEKEMSVFDEEEKMWNMIMTNIKKMVAASH